MIQLPRNNALRLLVENVCMIIVDEVSTIDTKHIAFLDFRLQQLLSNNNPFGGMPIMFSGDFNQLGPVLKDFIPTTMMLFAKRHKKTSHSGKKKHYSTPEQSAAKKAKITLLSSIQKPLRQQATMKSKR